MDVQKLQSASSTPSESIVGRRGRPRSAVGSARLGLRLAARDLKRWRVAAHAQGFRSLSAFVRASVDERVEAKRTLLPEELAAMNAATEQLRRAGVNELLYRAILAAKEAGPTGPARTEFEAAAAALRRAAEVLAGVFEPAARKLKVRS